jgi:hypothetical protein
MSKLRDLELTAGQLRQFRAIAAQAEPGKAAPMSKASAAYRTALAALRDALAADDDDKIAAAQDRLDTLRDQEKLEDAPDPSITDSARKQAPAAVSLLTASQVAAYLSANEDDVSDPLELMMDALDQLADKPPADEYAGIRSELTSQVAMLLAGLDKKAQEPIAKKVSEWLDAAHSVDASRLESERSKFEKSAREITGKDDAFGTLRNWMQREMAVLLSNPALPEAIDELAKASAE